MQFLPSIASANQLNLQSEIERLGDWPTLHIDIEDGNFLPNITFGLKTVSAVSSFASSKELDAHLLVNHPLEYVKPLAECGITRLCSHIESLPYPLQFINSVHHQGMKAGLAMNFSTPLACLDPFLCSVDYVLFMTAEPDENGNQLYEPALERAIRFACAHPEIPVIVDGGLNENAISKLNSSPVSAAVLGRLCWQADDPLSRLQSLSNI